MLLLTCTTYMIMHINRRSYRPKHIAINKMFQYIMSHSKHDISISHVSTYSVTRFNHTRSVAAGRCARGASARAAMRRGRHFEGRKYGIMKLIRFLQIVICIAYSDIFTPLISLTLHSLGTTPQLSVVNDSTQSSAYSCTLRNLHC